MDELLVRLPEGVELSPVAEAAFKVLAQHTAFPWPVLKTQAKRLGFDAASLSVEQLGEMIELLAVGVERFTSPEAGEQVRTALRALTQR
ncbi:MAG: hypothetical protein AAGA54_31580 [Myxococcota bacterium]